MAVGTPDTKDEADKAHDLEHRPGGINHPDNAPGGRLDGLENNSLDDFDKWEKEIKNNQTTADNFMNGGGFTNNVTGNSKTKAVGSGKKKKGPLVLILSLLGGGSVVGGIFGVMNLMPLNLMENLTGHYNFQDPSMQQRVAKIIGDKMTSNITTKTCVVTSLLCRYERPSNRFLNNLQKNGITAVDADGKPINSRTIFPNQRPAGFKMDGVTGSGKDGAVTAKEFSKIMSSNPNFRSAVTKAYNAKFMAMSAADPVIQKIKKLFGFNGKDNARSIKDEKDLNKNLNDSSAGEDIGTAEAAKQNGVTNNEKAPDGADSAVEKNLESAKPGKTGEISTSEKLIQKLLTTKVGSLFQKLARTAGKGSIVGTVATMACMGADIPNIITSVTRAYQLSQLVRFGATLFVAVNAIKAGDATSQEVSSIGDYLTATDSSGKSALDSSALISVLTGSTAGMVVDSSVQKFIPGYGAAKMLGGVQGVTNSAAVNNTCKVINNPVVQTAEGATEDLVLGAGTLGIGFVVKVAAQLLAPAAITMLMPYVAPMIVSWVQPYMNNILSWLLGDFTADIPAGPDRGNAIAAGVSSLMSSTATGGGNQALTVSQAVAYEKLGQEQQIADAQMDRATLSPFDTSSPYTFMGSLVNKMLPYYSNFSSISGTLSFMANVLPISIGSLLNKPVSADEQYKKEWQQCQQTQITQAQSRVGGSDADPIAADGFCNVYLGVPVQYLNKDPAQVANEMINTYHAVDDKTGQPVPDNEYLKAYTGDGFTISYASWLDMCTDPTSNDNIGACMITNDQVADYALYTIDQRAMYTIDGDPAITVANPDTAYTDIPSNEVANNYADAMAMMGNYLTDGGVDTLTNGNAIADNSITTPIQTVATTVSDIVKNMPQPKANSIDGLLSLRLETPLWV